MPEIQQPVLILTTVPGRVRRSQSPNSWLFYDARISAGFPTLDSLAERIGVPKATIFLWQRGGRPAPHRIRQLHEILGVPLAEVAEALYGEREGDPCPGGCGRPKVFSEKFPGLRSLAIDASCTCGTERILKPYQCREHQKPCKKCAYAARRVKQENRKITVACIGYWDHNKYSPCSRTRQLAPWQINREQRQAKKGQRGSDPNSQFDPSSGKFQCRSCSNLERLIRIRERRLQELEAEATGKKNPSDVRIQSQRERARLQSRHWSKTNPQLIEIGTTTLKSLPRNSRHRSADARAKGHLFRELLRKDKTKRHSFCRGCGDWHITAKKRAECHGECRGLPPRRRSHVKEESQKIAWEWAIEFGILGKSFHDIAEDAGKDYAQVRREVMRLIDHLVPQKLPKRYQRQAGVLVEEVKRCLASGSE